MMASTDVARYQSRAAARRPGGGQQTIHAHYEITDAQTPARPQTRSRPVPREYSTAPRANPSRESNSISVLEAEYLATMFLIFLTVFTDQTSSYSSKMLAVMKRMTFASILFFILGLLSTGSENTAKFSKAVGLLVLAGVFLGTAGQGTISAMDHFFKADWTQGDTTQGDSSGNAPAGTQTTGSGKAKSKLQQAEEAAQNAINRVGGGVFGTGSNNPALKALEQLLGAI